VLTSPERRLELVVNMTLILLLIYSGGRWFVQVPVVMLASGALLFPELRRSSRIWFVLAVVLLAGYAQQWSFVDNHKYLLGYWCLALYCALRSADTEESLAVNARWLIAFCFTFATLWKLQALDFLDSRFFHFTLLVDRRFQTLMEVVGGLSAQMVEGNQQALGSLLQFQSSLMEVRLQSSPSLAFLARLLTYGSVFLEGLTAIAFLAPATGPGASLHRRLRHLLLLAFVLSTYALAPVIGFGWLLLVMGLAQLPRDSSIAWAYPATFLFLQLYRVPWGDLIGL